jgi:Subtilase family
MACLILHGDRNENGPSIGRPLYVRPLMANENGREVTDRNRLLVDTIYRAVVRIKGSDEQEAAAPSVFLVNLSLGDSRRPFAGIISPLARLLDFLSERYNILFLVSGGNIGDPLTLPEFDNWTSFEGASADEKKRSVLRALNAAKHERTILSPAESLNALTIGGQHHDSVVNRIGGNGLVDPFDDNTLPNISSGLGLGHRRTIKPEIYLPGGREYVRFRGNRDGLEIVSNSAQRLYGLAAAAPDTRQGRLNYSGLTNGTSSATALATHAAHHIFAALMDRDGGSLLVDLDPQYYAIVVKCLLVHSARWNGNNELLMEICGPESRRRFVERAENSSRFIGFGVANIAQVIECAENRATLVGHGALLPNNAHGYRIPLPGCLEHVTDPRSLTVTVAWFSSVRPGHQNYRCVRMEAAPLQALQGLGVERQKSQPADASVKRGGIFHEHFEGEAAIPYIDDGHLALQVWCKEDAGLPQPTPIRYAVAVTIHAGRHCQSMTKFRKDCV